MATSLSSSHSSTSSSSTSSSLKSTVWIGNIDSKATEAQILKLVKPHGKVVKFDFIYSHVTDTSSERIPRGYAFVTYDNYVSADKATRALNGVQVLSKCLKVQISSSNSCSSSNSSNGSGGSLPLSLSMTLDKKTDSKTTKLSKIKAMEAKLKALERSDSDEFRLAVPGLKSINRSQKPYDKPLKKSK